MSGLVPKGYSRFNIAAGYAAFADWWNEGGLTDRCRQKGRSISNSLHKQKYRPGIGGYLEDEQDIEVYLSLVERYHPESLETERAEQMARLDVETGAVR